ncbi:MAG: hypothetical protein JWO67_2885 [Streptosporangiaceae bacterium]|nr:hypothetical protein [Streptosporangiaceae bacterium]
MGASGSWRSQGRPPAPDDAERERIAAVVAEYQAFLREVPTVRSIYFPDTTQEQADRETPDPADTP